MGGGITGILRGTVLSVDGASPGMDVYVESRTVSGLAAGASSSADHSR